MAIPRLFFSFVFLFLHLIISVPVTHASCPLAPPCGPDTPPVRFPFRVDTQDTRCGYPGFDLSCNNRTKTLTLNIPQAGNLMVNNIDYMAQAVYVSDPGLCLPKRFLDGFNLSGSPFSPVFTLNAGFFNCSGDDISLYSGGFYATCLSDDNFTIVITRTDLIQSYESLSSSPLCKWMGNRSIPVQWVYWPRMGETLQLTWKQPDCRSCEKDGGACGFKSSSGFDMACTDLPSNGLPRSAKYGIILGLGIPGVLCLIGLGCCLWGKLKMCSSRRDQPMIELVDTVISQRALIICGLDKSTIESYPKTLIGESKRLPEPNQNTCSICLSEYQPKEVLRSIPECNHYFHLQCVDEWLRVNKTCPLCRNSPQHSDKLSLSTSSSLASLTSFPLPPG